MTDKKINEVMSDPLKATLTGSMESVSGQEVCIRPPCDDAKQTDKSLQPTTDIENAQDLDTTHTDQPSRPDVGMDTRDSALESDSPSDAPKHEPEEAVADSPNDASGTGKRQIDNCISPLSLKRKHGSVDESKLGQHFQENATLKKKMHQKAKAVQAARRAAERNSRPKYFVKDWIFLTMLGTGAFGEVKLAYNDKTKERAAVKIINMKKARTATNLRDIEKEIGIHQGVSGGHRSILRFLGSRKEKDMQYVFLQYAVGGDLFNKIDSDGIPQAGAQLYYRQLIDGLGYLHMLGVAHRDIKPENLLLDESDNLKIGDFGFATVFRSHGRTHRLDRFCGTPSYLAPEVFNCRPYRAEPADIWASGIVLAFMLVGDAPWEKAKDSCTEYMKWREGRLEDPPWKKLDNLILGLLRMVLTENPEKRFTLEQIQNHPWFKKDFSIKAPQQLSMGPNHKHPRYESETEQLPR